VPPVLNLQEEAALHKALAALAAKRLLTSAQGPFGRRLLDGICEGMLPQGARGTDCDGAWFGRTLHGEGTLFSEIGSSVIATATRRSWRRFRRC